MRVAFGVLAVACVLATPGCKKKGGGHEPPTSCPPGRPTRQTLNGDAVVNATKVAILDPRQTLKLRALTVPRSSYLTIFAQRPLAPGDADHTYDVISCIDSSLATQWHQVPLVDATGVAYLRLRARMWNPTGSEIQLETRQDPGTGEAGTVRSVKLKCPAGSSTLDDLVDFERVVTSPTDAGVSTDGAVP